MLKLCLASPGDVLMDVAKRDRVDTEKLQKAVAEELAAKRDKKTKATAKRKARKTAARVHPSLDFWRSAGFALRHFLMDWISCPSAFNRVTLHSLRRLSHAALRVFVAVFRPVRGFFRAAAAVFLALGAALVEDSNSSLGCFEIRWWP